MARGEGRSRREQGRKPSELGNGVRRPEHLDADVAAEPRFNQKHREVTVKPIVDCDEPVIWFFHGDPWAVSIRALEKQRWSPPF